MPGKLTALKQLKAAYLQRMFPQNGESAPKMRFFGFADDWEQRRLGDIMTFSNGINAPKENYGKGRKMISVLDILAMRPIEYDNIKSSVEVDSKIENNNKLEYGDLVFVRSSEVVSEVGWVKAYLDKQYALYSGFSIRGKRRLDFDALFVELLLNSRGREQIERKAGGSTRFNVSQLILGDIDVLLPNINEQSHIGTFFRTLDTLIANQKRKLDELLKLKRSYLQLMFPQDGEAVPRMRFSGFTEPWKQKKLEDIANISSGFTGDSALSSGIYKLTRIESISSGHLDMERLGFSNTNPGTKFKLNSGDILYSNLNSIEHIGKVAIVHEQESDVYHGINLLRLGPYSVFPFFLYTCFLTNNMTNWAKSRANKAISQASINQTTLSGMVLHVPCPAEQTAIGNFFHNLDNQIALYQ